MKKKFKDTKFAKFFQKKGVKAVGDVVKGLILDPIKLGAAPVVGSLVGLLQGVSENKKKNLDSDTGGKGKPNYFRLFGLLIFVILALSYILGWIEQSTFEVMFNRLKEILVTG